MKTFKLTAAFLAMCFVLTISIQAQDKAYIQSTIYNNAVYLSQSTPGDMNPGQSYGISVTMRNSGTSVWRQGNYTLKLINVTESVADSWVVKSVDVNSTVNSGQDVVFNFSVTAPMVEGGYNLQWQMAEGNSFFGEPTMSVPIRVSGPTIKANNSGSIENNSLFVSQKVQSEMDAGQTYDVVVIMKNTGSTTWKPGEYKLKVSTKGGDNTGAWAVANVELSGNVYSDSEVIFSFKVTAPGKSGTYNLQCQVVKDGTFFGEPTTNVIVNVN
jgi:hypothetical protein